MKKTTWFPGSLTPDRPGRYERLYSRDICKNMYSRAISTIQVCVWDGTNWTGPEVANPPIYISSYQNLEWRVVPK